MIVLFIFISDIFLNLKAIAVKVHSPGLKKMYLKSSGSGEVRAGNFETDSETEIMNPDQLIMTLDSNADVEIEANVETGKGYISAEVAEDENKIIKQFIFANKQRLETFETMRRKYDAAKFMGMSDKEIRQIFKDRNMEPLFKLIRKNKFKPFGVTEGMEDAYKKLAERYDIPNPLTKRIRRRLNKIEKRLKKQRLNKEFKIDEERYLLEPRASLPAGMDKAPTTPLPQTPMPDQKLVASMPQINQQTGLTSTEAALLSPSEQEIARRT